MERYGAQAGVFAVTRRRAMTGTRIATARGNAPRATGPDPAALSVPLAP
jgi:hypothetical protein